MPRERLFNKADAEKMARLMRAIVGGLLGAITAPVAYMFAAEFVMKLLGRRADESELLRQPIIGMIVGGAIFGAILLGKAGKRALPRWVASSSLGALAGMVVMAILASIHASNYEGKFAAPVQIAWLVYGTIPFLAIGALLGVFIDRRKQNARLPIETE